MKNTMKIAAVLCLFASVGCSSAAQPQVASAASEQTDPVEDFYLPYDGYGGPGGVQVSVAGSDDVRQVVEEREVLSAPRLTAPRAHGTLGVLPGQKNR